MPSFASTGEEQFDASNLAASCPAPQAFTATTSSSEMVAANQDRKGVWIQNIGAKEVFIGIGNAAEVDKGIRIVRNERIQFGSTMLPTEAINVISSSGSQVCLYQEFA